VPGRSPVKSSAHRKMLLRGLAGASLCVAAIVAVAGVASLLGARWPGGRDAAAPRIATMPDGSPLGSLVTDDPVADQDRAKRKADRPRRHLEATRAGSDVVVASGAVLPAPQLTPAPAASPTPVAPATKKPTVVPKPAPAPDQSSPSTAPTALQPIAAARPGDAGRSASLVRLSVRSIAIAADSSGNPELQAKLAIDGAKASDAVPDTVTLHLRPRVPASVPKDDPTLAMKANVDMVEVPRTAPTDPSLRMRVRMAIVPVEKGTPVVEEPGAGDGKSNVIALTVSLASFAKAPDAGTPVPLPTDPDPPSGDPDQPPTGPTDPGQPGGGPDDPTPPDQPTGPDPTVPDQPTGPDPTVPDQPTGPDPTVPDPTVPGQPTGPNPTVPDQPSVPAPQPTPPVAGEPGPVIPPIEIIIPVGPVRPNTGTVSVPVTPGTGNGDGTAVDPIPIEIVLEELPPDEPPLDPEVPAPGVEEPSVEVPTPPTDADPGSPPAATPSAADSAVVVSASGDVPPPDANS
jgi:hypothetical protein